MGLIVPLYSLQLGMERCDPLTIALLLATLPLFMYVIQVFDKRLTLSSYSLVGIILTVVFLLVSVVGRNSGSRSR